MSERRTLDVSGLPPYEISSQSPLFWGQVLMCVIEGSLFCMLIATYFYLRLGVDVWPGPGVHLPGLTLSSLCSHSSRRQLRGFVSGKRGRKKGQSLRNALRTGP